MSDTAYPEFWNWIKRNWFWPVAYVVTAVFLLYQGWGHLSALPDKSLDLVNAIMFPE